jgi:carbon storage regulator
VVEYLRVYDHVGFFVYSIRKVHRITDSSCAVICPANGGYAMLVLSRKNDEAVVIGGSAGFERIIKVTVLGIKNGQVRLGFEADADVPVHRLEVWERICGETGLADLRY